MQLRCSLPWLPAYDRRDALVVVQLLDHIAGFNTSDVELGALGWSLFAAAQLHPSVGDAVGIGEGLNDWLPSIDVCEQVVEVVVDVGHLHALESYTHFHVLLHVLSRSWDVGHLDPL